MGLFRRLFSKSSHHNTPGTGNGASAAPQNTTLNSDDWTGWLERILSDYPQPLAERYRHKSLSFQQAIVLAYQGEERRALDQLAELPAKEHDDLFDYELGIMMARHGHKEKACSAMKSCLRTNPDHLLAAETLVLLLVELGESDQALELVLKMLLEQRDAAFCHAQLASLYHLRQEDELALPHCLDAIKAGHNDPNVVLLGATLLEQKNELEQAEALYAKINDNSGNETLNLYHAEFLLRQQRDLPQVLKAFNLASQHQPDNPRWPLRMAQTQLALGAKRKGLKLLHTVLADHHLTDALRSEGQALLKQHS